MRYWEIDEARGKAVILMVLYHFIFDLFYPYNNQFYWIATVTASIFILVSGISLSISHARGSKLKKFAKRGLKLFILAAIVTAFSFLFLDWGFIFFGILHFFALTSVLIYPFLKSSKRPIALFLGILFIIVGVVFSKIAINVNYLIWLGLTPYNFYTFDFFPIFPWFGLLLIGTYIGSHMYPNGKRGFKIREPDNTMSKSLQFLGKNSLAVYFIHQPIILLLLSVFVRTEVLSMLNL